MSSLALPLLSLAALLCLAAAGLCFDRYLAARRRLGLRLKAAAPPARPAPLPVHARMLRRLARSCLPLAARLGPPPLPLTALLARAGHPGGLTAVELQGLRAAGLFVALAGGGLLGLTRLVHPVAVPLLALAAWHWPWLWLRQRARDRQAAIAAALPDCLDQLSVGLAAGLATDTALALVAESLGGPLGEEMRRYVQAVELGVGRSEALAALRRRCDVAELEQLAHALGQGYELGVPVAANLAQQARHLRSLQAETARELAARASPKIILVTTFIITPGVMLLILGLLILNLIYNPGSFGLAHLFG